MSSWELNLGPEYIIPRPKDRGFQKGHTLYTKNKKWDDFMPKRKQKKILKALKRFRKENPHWRPENSGRPKKNVICVHDDGSFTLFPSLAMAAKTTGISDSSICRCCKKNKERKMMYTTKGKPLNNMNTEHRCNGFRFYFEEDPIWMTKIKNN